MIVAWPFPSSVVAWPIRVPLLSISTVPVGVALPDWLETVTMNWFGAPAVPVEGATRPIDVVSGVVVDARLRENSEVSPTWMPGADVLTTVAVAVSAFPAAGGETPGAVI